jgi:hypothetical protein
MVQQIDATMEGVGRGGEIALGEDRARMTEGVTLEREPFA